MNSKIIPFEKGMEYVQKQARSTRLVANAVPYRHVLHFNAEKLADEGYRKNAVASACISEIATSVQEAKLRIYEAGTDIEVKEHWLLDAIGRPNPWTSTYELWEMTLIFLHTAGNCYWELVREDPDNPLAPIKEIVPLRPDRIEIVPHPTDLIDAYVYKGDDGNEITYEPHEILHFKFPDPLDDFYGLSPLQRLAKELDIDNESSDFTATFFKNAGIPYGFFKTDRVVTDNEAKRERRKWYQWFKSVYKWVPTLLGRGVEFQQLSLDFEKMEIETLRSVSEARICGVLGVDPILVSAYTGLKLSGKYANYAEARKSLWDETVIPHLERLISKINSQVLFYEGLEARWDLSEVEALQENKNEQAQRVALLFEKGISTLNEARKLVGLEPEEGTGDFYFNGRLFGESIEDFQQRTSALLSASEGCETDGNGSGSSSNRNTESRRE